MDDLDVALVMYLEDEQSSEESELFKNRSSEGVFQILVRCHPGQGPGLLTPSAGPASVLKPMTFLAEPSNLLQSRLRCKRRLWSNLLFPHAAKMFP
ncbi:hypothetical protein TNIN_369651 [Trichonephila inaurata madagascariensis]|uniref:Uncharacterized protein n=1 Tax=Trichonephila inaurata madagascariensis TaxID=2747483 RepID=A0A8X6YU00_9ARAC|nr:hypothetical protein TNIN_369651 [Trichonephila inaurata madagascariensis]